MKFHPTHAFITSALLFGFAQSTYAASNCAGIDNDIARLQCYDERERQINGESTGTSIVRESVTKLPVREKTRVNVEVQASTSLQEPQSTTERVRVVEKIVYVERLAELPIEIQSTITRLSKTVRNHQVFVLENGQRWQEIRESGLRFKVGSDVILSKGLMSAYNLKAGRNSVRVAQIN